ncbi:hypothetical protein [Bacillus muralis]|uniref:hypothetical protein n=1 Tax=Peribacillus muralis TaxID=264697 RepID=UPI0007D7AC5B
MITSKNAESYLKNKIGNNTDDIKEVWEIFKAFCIERVEGEDDQEILFQCGISDFSGDELLYFDFVRQFTVYEEDEYSRMEQLHCEFSFKPTDELRKVVVSKWSMDFDHLSDFFTHLETLQEFQVPLNLKQVKIEIYQEEV